MASDDEVTEALARIGEGHGSESVLRSCVDVLCRRVAALRAELAERTRERDALRDKKCVHDLAREFLEGSDEPQGDGGSDAG